MRLVGRAPHLAAILTGVLGAASSYAMIHLAAPPLLADLPPTPLAGET